MMKKLSLITCVLVALTATVHAQETFAKRDIIGHVGIGIGGNISGSGYKIAFPPLLISGEYGVMEGLINGKGAIGVGGYLAYASDKYTGTDIKQSHVIFGARGLFHYQFVDKLDTYAGLMLGYESVSVSNNQSHFPVTGSDFLPGLFIGGRYYFTDRLAAFTELGYGIAFLQLGLAVRF
ncbi:MAG: outer membrane beta-barrel protein [Odoribacteraceae bacterium]|jgi:hypothetical protein|nr:outer membrane beta-barrel protein [Odoribacteraceae bacterium]